MEKQKEGETGKECCSKKACCGTKALIAIGLLAVGGIGGYLCGKNCHKGCAVKDAPAVSAPAQTK